MDGGSGEVDIHPRGYLPPPLSNFQMSESLKEGLAAASFFSIVSALSTFFVLHFILYGIVSQNHAQRNNLIHNGPLILIANLFIADFFEALAGCISLHWLRIEQILAPTIACSVQAILLHVGVVCNGFFVLAIAVLTWLRIVRRTAVERWYFLLVVCGIWLLGLVLAFDGLVRHPRDFFAAVGSCVRSNDRRRIPWEYLADVVSSAGSLQCTESTSSYWLASGFWAPKQRLLSYTRTSSSAFEINTQVPMLDSLRLEGVKRSRKTLYGTWFCSLLYMSP